MIADPLPAPILAAVPALDALRWERSVLLLFAASASDPDLALQRSVIERHRERWRGQGIAIVEVVGESILGVRDYAPRLRQRYRVGSDVFAAILLGRDGDTKLRSREPIALSSLLATLDARSIELLEPLAG